jgi:type II secretory pathway component PulF
MPPELAGQGWAVGALLAAAVLLWPTRAWSAVVQRDGPGAEAGNPETEGDGIPDRLGGADVAAALEFLALVLAAGGGLVDAVEAVARTSQGAVRAHLTTVATAVRWGMPWSVAWGAVGPDWARARSAMLALRRAAAQVRADQLQQLELAAARLGVAIVLPLGLAFLPAFVLLTVVPLVIAIAADVWA